MTETAAVEVLTLKVNIECITQDPKERAVAAVTHPRCLEVCTGRANLMAASPRCVDAGCGGHPICRPCYEVCAEDGWVVRPVKSP